MSQLLNISIRRQKHGQIVLHIMRRLDAFSVWSEIYAVNVRVLFDTFEDCEIEGCTDAEIREALKAAIKIIPASELVL